MPIKFTCPHCKRAMIVADSLAGKKGRCKACQQILTVPKPANAKPSAPAPSPPAPAAPKSEPPPPPPSADVEAEAAALFADEPKTEEPAEVKTIDLNCPFCDEAIQFTADLAGKRAPCPECKHIIKVPELVKKEPKDWRKADRRGPAGARLPDQPELEGAWGSVTAGKVGRDTLEKVGVIPKVKPPRTLWQKVRWPLVGVGAVVLLAGFGWGGYRWWSGQAVARALKEALDYAASPQSEKEIGKAGQAELFLAAGTFYQNGKKSDSAVEANKQLGKAFTALSSAPSNSERDAVWADYALALVDLAGDPAEVAEGHRLSWDEIQKRLGAVLAPIRDLDGRRRALREISRRLIARGETPRVMTLVNQAYSTPDDEKAAALCIVALELLPKDQDKAQKAVEDALKLYEDKKPPPVRAEVVALGLLVKNKAPKLPEDADEKQKANEQVGQIAALALKGEKWEEARKKANALEGDTKFRALLALAVAAV
jgi:tetratricopeptide (TPR) repeat protein